MTLINKAAGVADPISLSDVTRGYVATTQSADGSTNQAILTGLSTANDDQAAGLVVAPGGFAQNNDAYQGANYLIAEYGSLSQQQRNVSYVKKAAQAVCA